MMFYFTYNIPLYKWRKPVTYIIFINENNGVVTENTILNSLLDYSKHI